MNSEQLILATIAARKAAGTVSKSGVACATMEAKIAHDVFAEFRDSLIAKHGPRFSGKITKAEQEKLRSLWPYGAK